jgi:hypothetical protein
MVTGENANMPYHTAISFCYQRQASWKSYYSFRPMFDLSRELCESAPAGWPFTIIFTSRSVTLRPRGRERCQRRCGKISETLWFCHEGCSFPGEITEVGKPVSKVSDIFWKELARHFDTSRPSIFRPSREVKKCKRE